MDRSRMARMVVYGFTSILLLAAYGCVGSETDGDGGESFTETFVVSDSTVGTISLNVTSTRMAVGRTSGFKVDVKNQDGAPVDNVQIACDTEAGLAIIEPTTGLELTDSFGSMSGIVGCAAPGSFQMACRLPIGANRREFVTIVCEGEVPDGFAGFPGAAGGGLGSGGVAVGDDGTPGGAGASGFRISNIELTSGGPFIDTIQVDCAEADAEEPECETFFDDSVAFTIVNNSNVSATVSSYNYTVRDANGSGLTFTSKSLALSPIEIAPGGDAQVVTGLFTEVRDRGVAGACTGGKRFPDAAFTIPGDLGFRNITFRVTISTELGDSVTLTGRAAFSFDGYDNC